MHTVKRAIIMAAGKGSRLQPITLTTPKPLIPVNGVRMIDSIIGALHKNSIYEIYIVVGHLKEQFYDLAQQYQGITIIENPYYNECNNISSLYVARNYLKDVIILDGDQFIFNPEILSPSFEYSGYNAIWTDVSTNEWLMTVKDGIVTNCSRTGGIGGWQLFSISRWTEEDGNKLRTQLEHEFIRNHNIDIYWDDLPMFLYPHQYRLGIREMKKNDVIEIDSLDELITIDSTYIQKEN